MISGLDPDLDPEGEWVFDDFSSPVVATVPSPASNIFALKLRDDLPFREIYFHIEPCLSVSTADYFITGELKLSLNGQPVEIIPASEGKDVNGLLLTAKSICGIGCLSGSSANNTPVTSNAQNALKVVTGNKFTNGIDTAQLNPHRCVSRCNQISYSCLGAAVGGATMTCYRVFLAVHSQNYSF